VSQTGNPFLEFTDAHLKAAMLRALRLVAILGGIAFVALWATMGWQTAMLLLSGAVVSASGLWEWQKLITLINARLDAPGAAEGGTSASGGPGSARVVLGFFLRLAVAAAVLYGSLRCFHGSVYALVGGLGLAAFALGVEAVRLIRS
jgi:hypothetical protein